MTTKVRYPRGAWPVEMRADMAAAYVDEPSVEAFMAKVEAGLYPKARKAPHSARKWSRHALDHAVASGHGTPQDAGPETEDAAELV